MASNDFLADLVGKGLRTQDLLDDRLEKPDGLKWVDSRRFTVVPSAGTTFAFERGAAGDYRMIRTAAGAETHYLVLPVSAITRKLAGKGISVSDVVFVYSLVTADATSVDVTVNSTTYANAVAPVVATYGGTLAYDANHNTAAKRKSSTGGVNPHLMTVTLPSPAYQVVDDVWISAEMTVVLPNTSVFRLYGGAFHLSHDYL